MGEDKEYAASLSATLSLVKTLVTGSVAYDVVLSYDGSFVDAIDPEALENLSVSFFSPHFARHHGGTGANIAWNLRLLGGDPLLVSTVGSDGGEYLALLEERGVPTDFIEKKEDAVTATAIIGTDSSERQIAFFHPGADAVGDFGGGREPLADFRDDIGYAIISPRNPVLMMEAVRWCDTYKVPFLFDPGQQVILFSDDELSFAVSRSAGVITNEYEWEMLCRKLACTEESLLEKTGMVIITRGENGATCFYEGGECAVSACKADQVVNPTGAGDAFRAGVLRGLLEGWEHQDCMRLGAAISSHVVEIEGTLLDAVDSEQVLLRAEATYGEPLPTL